MGQPCCHRCGAVLAPDAPEGLCSACVLQIATEYSRSEPASGLSSADSDPLEEIPQLRAGEIFGPYRIDHLLGRGGMGDVYAADHIGQGRRLAIKLLSRRLVGSEDRERFLNEGQLAAAVNHPNCVYVYGSEEIDGTLVITMELVPGGTLRDRVRDRGPLNVTEAVDAMLQVASGLEAAHRAGILHRDVKPSNCFVDIDQCIKVGDFGLSIPVQPTLGGNGAPDKTFQGTPGFAPPEQLRGEPVDLRADIYAVGATLYYLLTGEAPGAHRGLSALAAGMDAMPVQAPSLRRSEIPKPLDAAILRCLSVECSARPSSYVELVSILAPFGSSRPAPAHPGQRVAAGVLDLFILLPIVASCLGGIVGSRLVTDQVSALFLGILLPGTLYWGTTEGVSGASFGKRASGLRVVGLYGDPPGFIRGLVRSSLFVAPAALALALAFVSRHFGWPWQISALMFEIATLGQWSMSRPANGFLGLHELISGTRVVAREPELSPTRTSNAAELAPLEGERGDYGPYRTMGAIGLFDSCEVLLAFDARLKRQVWIHAQPVGTASVSKVVQKNGRATRLRWLHGQRSNVEAWDAYEAPDGAPLLDLSVPVPWVRARRWLLDLANELDSGLRDRSVGRLSLDRVWITGDQRAKLLTFRAPGVPDSAPADDLPPMSFLQEVVRYSLNGVQPTAVPFGASVVRSELASGAFKTPVELADALNYSSGPQDRVTRRQRCVALTLSVITYVLGAGWLGGPVAELLNSIVTPPTLAIVLDGRIVGAFGAALVGLTLSAMSRGGFWIRILGIVVITRDGQEASRFRALARAAIVWVPLPLGAILGRAGWHDLSIGVALAQFVFILYAADHPDQGIHDRMTGTFLVPR